MKSGPGRDVFEVTLSTLPTLLSPPSSLHPPLPDPYHHPFLPFSSPPPPSAHLAGSSMFSGPGGYGEFSVSPSLCLQRQPPFHDPTGAPLAGRSTLGRTQPTPSYFHNPTPLAHSAERVNPPPPTHSNPAPHISPRVLAETHPPVSCSN